MKKTNVQNVAKKVTKEGGQCEICDKWNHSKCAGITRESRKIVKQKEESKKEIEKILDSQKQKELDEMAK